MKKSLLALSLCLILVLSACGQQPENVIRTPAGIFPEPPQDQTPAKPASYPQSAADWCFYQAKDYFVPPEEEDLTERELVNRRAEQRDVWEFLQDQLTHGETITGIEPLEEGQWLAIGYRITEKGIIDPFRIRASVTPDGKYYALLSMEELPQEREWSAIQSFAFLLSSLDRDHSGFLPMLGYPDANGEHQQSAEEGSWFQTDLSYSHVTSMILRYMTPELFEQYLSPLFQDREGKLRMACVGGGCTPCSVLQALPLAENRWLAHMFQYTGEALRMDYYAEVELEERPDGSFRVSGWKPGGESMKDLWESARLCRLPLASSDPGQGADIQSFSYQEALEQYPAGTPGVLREGFHNTGEAEVQNAAQAIQRAAEEYGVTFDGMAASFDSDSQTWQPAVPPATAYDPEARMWRIGLSAADTPGDSVDIYLDADGVTRLIVCGE